MLRKFLWVFTTSRMDVVNTFDRRRFNVAYRDSMRRLNGAYYLFFDSAHGDTGNYKPRHE